MKTGLKIGLPVLALIAIAIYLKSHDQIDKPAVEPVAAVYQQQRLLRFNYEITNLTGSALKDETLELYVPLEKTSTQNVRAIKASLPYQTNKDQYGNQSLRFQMKTLPPYGKKTIQLTVEIETAVQPNQQLLKHAQTYLRAEKYIEVESKQLKDLANSLATENVESNLKNIYDWVSTKVQYPGYIANDRGALLCLSTSSW